MILATSHNQYNYIISPIVLLVYRVLGVGWGSQNIMTSIPLVEGLIKTRRKQLK
ncbi:unknown protein [Microcystis aeruginosa NIES-843]|uniref:Uncharacterized protein n=1 Tax=Microcystis aeruginosa (strain NIES-843 / IAM M-2473) TaxID=449447 RepID=B0JWL5_MICAN|nr:unknown protein [Microcystis aeruginosa NIES-843]